MTRQARILAFRGGRPNAIPENALRASRPISQRDNLLGLAAPGSLAARIPLSAMQKPRQSHPSGTAARATRAPGRCCPSCDPPGPIARDSVQQRVYPRNCGDDLSYPSRKSGNFIERRTFQETRSVKLVIIDSVWSPYAQARYDTKERTRIVSANVESS